MNLKVPKYKVRTKQNLTNSPAKFTVLNRQKTEKERQNKPTEQRITLSVNSKATFSNHYRYMLAIHLFEGKNELSTFKLLQRRWHADLAIEVF